MGIYVNPDNEVLRADMRQDIYVDKSLILEELNKVFGSSQSRVCVSRPRRFGKTMVGNMISAYYSKGSDSRELFQKLGISGKPGWDERLNKCNVIKIDMLDFWDELEPDATVGKITEAILMEMREEFPGVLTTEATIADAIRRVYLTTKVPFVFIIDEYDIIIRERMGEAVLNSYLILLRTLFKAGGASAAIGLAYITGILPIVRDKVQSKLNNVFDEREQRELAHFAERRKRRALPNFNEFTMLNPGVLAPFVGFTLQDVKELCDRFGMDYAECLRWYDGYKISSEVSVCNSNSVFQAMRNHKYDDYWTLTGAYTAINDFIDYDFDGIRQDIAVMVGGGSVAVNVGEFMNKLTEVSSRDDVFTYLIHLGYLAYDEKTATCHIPNGEIRKEWEKALKKTKRYEVIFEMLRNSESLLKATLACDEKAVAEALDKAHDYVTSADTYNNEGALQSAVGLAYFSATSEYNIEREKPAGRGRADLVFLPFVKNRPAIVIELKWNKDAKTAMEQILKKKYAKGAKGYADTVYLVGVNYDPDTRVHDCKIKVVNV